MKSIRLVGFLALMLVAASPAYAIVKAPEVREFARHKGKQDVEVALTEWKSAVESASVDNIMKLYDKNAIMISTFAQNPMTKRSEISSYFKKVVTNPDIKVELEESHPRVFGNVAVNSGRYTLNYTQEGEPVSIPARFSFTYVLSGGKWLIVDMHSSRVPLPGEVK